jgi:hypothetical protein
MTNEGADLKHNEFRMDLELGREGMAEEQRKAVDKYGASMGAGSESRSCWGRRQPL